MMNKRIFAPIALAAWVVLAAACGTPKEQVSPDVQKIVKKMEEQWDVIDESVAEIERRRTLLYDDNKKQLEEIQKQIESIQSALKEMRAQLNTVRTKPSKTTVPPKRLPIEISIVLLVIAVFCVLLFLKLRSVRMREITLPPPEKESADESDGESPES